MKKLNVLLICTDHWPAKLLGCAGHTVIMTPTLDSLASSGIRFTHAYSGTPTCIPARREIMTGTSAKTHGDRIFNEDLRMDPTLKTLPQAFHDAGYQTFSVGKLHVFPQRNRIGFDDALICEEGRHMQGLKKDDYEMSLSDAGYNGMEFVHGLSNNEYSVRPWHLPERLHPTYWITKEMCRQIIRRDQSKPAFWHCSYPAPHPPITPPKEYLEMYPEERIDAPVIGEWCLDADTIPYALKAQKQRRPGPGSEREIRLARAGFYAQCTYIDHQLRLLIGTLREEGILDDTVIVFISDHGDMLGDHNLWAKPPLFDPAANIPFILVPAAGDMRFSTNKNDNRLVMLRDVMPTLLEICGIPIPESVEGMSLLQTDARDHVYCEHYEDQNAVRMVRDGNYKLLYYPCGNLYQLFDLTEDPFESKNLVYDPDLTSICERLKEVLKNELYGSDLRWLKGKKIIGMDNHPCLPTPNRELSNQRGWRW